MTAVCRWCRLRLVLACCCVLAGCRTAPKETVVGTSLKSPGNGHRHEAAARTEDAAAQQSQPGASLRDGQPPAKGRQPAADSPGSNTSAGLQGQEAKVVSSSAVETNPVQSGGAALETRPGVAISLPESGGRSTTLNRATAALPLAVPSAADKPARRDQSAPVSLSLETAKAAGATRRDISLPLPLENVQRGRPAGVPGARAPHLPEWVADSTNGDSLTKSIPLWNGAAGLGKAPASPATPLQMGAGLEFSPLSVGTNTAPPIRIEPLADETAGAKWREQQLVKQAADQKAREEAREKLRRALYKFLLQEEDTPEK